MGFRMTAKMGDGGVSCVDSFWVLALRMNAQR